MNSPGSAAIPSPCISLCKINQETELCEGCFRTLDEIVIWANASDQVKSEIWDRIALRTSGALTLASRN